MNNMNNMNDVEIMAKINMLKREHAEKDENMSKIAKDKKILDDEIKKLETEYSLMHNQELLKIEAEIDMLNKLETQLKSQLNECKNKLKENIGKKCNFVGHKWIEYCSFTKPSRFMECTKCNIKTILDENALKTGINPEKSAPPKLGETFYSYLAGEKVV